MTVGYILTHHPRISATFITNEIHALEAAGLTVFPMAVNSPSEAERAAPGAEAEVARTRYLKAVGTVGLVRLVLGSLRRNPGPVLSMFRRSVATAGTDARKAVWRLFHAVEALVAYEHCRANGVRHVHAHFGGLPSTLAWLVVGLGNDVDGPDSWSFSFTVHAPFEIEDVKDALVAEKFASARFVVAIADMTAAQLKRWARPEDWHKLRLVRCGVSTTRFGFEPRATFADPPTVTAVGRLDPEKGHLDLVEAIGLLRDRGRLVRLDIIGDGPGRGDLERLIAARGLGDRVQLLGSMPSPLVREQLRRTDVFALASYCEGIPIAIMEAMACGVPVVATNVGGIAELVVDEVTGRLVAPSRPDSLASAIEWLMDHPLERADIVVAARRAIEVSHDERTAIAPLVELFSDVVPPIMASR